MNTTGRIYVGTSGWSYPHWKGTFYPDRTKSSEQLPFYLDHCNSVELNNSFYRLPSPAAFKGWAASVSDNFIFSVKASRFFTHMKKLHLTRAELRPFFSSVKYLGEHLGPVLFQLPPNWKVNVERLAAFLKMLPGGFRYVFEFRNITWNIPAVYNLLNHFNCAYCWYHLEGYRSPKEITADFVYIRLHGPGAKYQGSYTKPVLRNWAISCKDLSAQGRDVYLYFDNDQKGYAAKNAGTIKSVLEQLENNKN